MSAVEAARRLDKSDAPCLMYEDDSLGGPRVIFRRNKGGYGVCILYPDGAAIVPSCIAISAWRCCTAADRVDRLTGTLVQYYCTLLPNSVTLKLPSLQRDLCLRISGPITDATGTCFKHAVELGPVRTAMTYHPQGQLVAAVEGAATATTFKMWPPEAHARSGT
eukprot:scaffold2697_cov392-Prasinococcus_capsulatus_cf.AAC.13